MMKKTRNMDIMKQMEKSISNKRWKELTPPIEQKKIIDELERLKIESENIKEVLTIPGIDHFANRLRLFEAIHSIISCIRSIGSWSFIRQEDAIFHELLTIMRGLGYYVKAVPISSFSIFSWFRKKTITIKEWDVTIKT